MGHKTIRKQLTLGIIPVVTLMIVLIMAVASWLLIENKTEAIEEQVKIQSESSANSIGGWISSVVSKATVMIDSVDKCGITDDEQLIKYMNSISIGIYDELPSGLYIGGYNKYYLDASGWVPDKDYIPSERDWFNEGMNNTSSVGIGEPYIDSESGQYVVSATRKISNNRVAAIDIFLEGMSKMVAKKATSGHLLLLSSSDEILASDNTELVGKKLKEANEEYIKAIVNDIDSIKSSSEAREIKGKKSNYICVASKIDGTSWTLINVNSTKEVTAYMKNVVTLAVPFAMILIAIFGIYTYLMIKKQTAQIKNISSAIENLHNGDFTSQIEVTGNNEVTELCSKVNEYMGQMKEMLSDIRGISNSLNDKAGITTESASLLKDIANKQEDSMNNMNITLEEFAKSTNEIAEGATTLASSADSLRETGRVASDSMESVVSVAEIGKKDMSRVKDNIDRLSATISELRDKIKDVEANANNISEITDTIKEIADQTNLLSLNASIEAARAGEQGRGFSVVAGEIGSLASNSAEASKTIEHLVEMILNSVAETVSKVEESVNDMQTSTEIISETGVAFEKVYEKASSTKDIMQNVVESINEINGVANNMAAVTEEQSASTEEVSATTNDMVEESININKKSKDIGDVADELNNYSNKLVEQISKYTLE